MNRTLLRLPTYTLVFVGLFTLAYFFLTHEGLYAIDDYFYSRYAYQLATGTFHLAPDPQGLLHDPLRERVLIFAPVALLYRLFGVDIITTTLWPLLCTLGCVGLFWALYRRREPMVASAAMLLLGLHYFSLNLSNYLYPDNILMFWCLASSAALLIGRRPERAAGVWGACFALLTFAALLSKETIVYYFPFYAALLLLDLRYQRHYRFWGVALSLGLVLLAGYLVYYQLYTNDALYRIHLIERTNDFLKEGNYLEGNRAALVARITWQPLSFFVDTGLGGVLILAVAALFGRRQHQGSDAGYWLGLAFTTLAFYWLGSTSLSQYNPITLLPRMTTPLLPPLCLAAGFGLRNFVQTGRGGWLLGLAMLAAAVWVRSSVSLIYGGLSLYFFGASWWVGPAKKQAGTTAFVSVALLAVAVCTAIRPVYFMRKPSVSSHFAQNRIIRQHLQAPARGVVFVDDFLIDSYDFYYGYQVPPGLTFRRYSAADSVHLGSGQHAWLLLNRSTLTNDELTRKLIRYSEQDVLQRFPQRRTVAEDGKVTLYSVE
ncbi:ArnT family glycosyltransferase [Hymenobacter cavernae]|uniref:Glycosyltransferase RgtA/B/C/D-like domain-containing protein n=1 Tax=Hymenobacter cavernae TaxID=2044852 RepID=A0ABQ1U6R1_9BACT|nr:hypothetical protein [Hymenobacter cavernae]GGF10238.1 hypothetical protein GCM10011383_21780 [Hymenobacter cavernae]